MRLRWVYSSLIILVQLPFRVLSAPAAACTLASLSLRYKDWPVDIVPAFKPNILSYTATLDFAMSSFSVDVRPVSGCDVDQAPLKPKLVQIGGSMQFTMFARRPETGAKQAYTVKVTRLLGSETELQSLRVYGGELSPNFDPTIRSYTVKLSPQYDKMLTFYKLRDNEQRLQSSAKAQFPTGSKPQSAAQPSAGSSSPRPAGASSNPSRRLTSGNTNSSAAELGQAGKVDSGTSDERLLLFSGNEIASLAIGNDNRTAPLRQLSVLGQTGEVQYKESYETFLIDVGFTRQLTLTVQCADPTQANIGTYSLTVVRPGCPAGAPFYDPSKSFCVNNCPAGYYRNKEISRCSQCNTNCEICTSLLECRMCKPDTADYSYIIQPDGSCRRDANHIFKKYWWWCVGFGVFLAFLLCIGMIGICQCICGAGNKRRNTSSAMYEMDSEDDDDEVEFATRSNLKGYRR